MSAMKQLLLDILESQEEGDEVPVFSFPPDTYKAPLSSLLNDDAE